MRTAKVNGHTVELYDSVDEMPVRRFQKYNKYLLIDSGVGSDVQDIIDHIGKVMLYMKKDPKLAAVELENMRQAVYLVGQEVSPKYMAFAVLVGKLDGEARDDLSDAGLKVVLDTLADVKKSWIDRVLDLVKKKIDEELDLYFPGKFETAAVKEYYDQLKRHTMLRLEHVIDGKDVDAECGEIEGRMAMLMKPKLYSGKQSAEIAYDKDFDEMCLVLSQNLHVRVREMTVLQFYGASEYLRKELKEREKIAKRRKKSVH